MARTCWPDWHRSRAGRHHASHWRGMRPSFGHRDYACCQASLTQRACRASRTDRQHTGNYRFLLIMISVMPFPAGLSPWPTSREALSGRIVHAIDLIVIS